MTQTPASGPVAPVTVPPSSFAPTALAPSQLMCAAQAARSAAIAAAATPARKPLPLVMSPPLSPVSNERAGRGILRLPGESDERCGDESLLGRRNETDVPFFRRVR